MVQSGKNQFYPDYVVYPGEILEETLEVIGMKKNEFAARCGLSEKHINQILHGKAPVKPQTAIRFERVLRISADLWNNLESNYRLFLAKQESQKILIENIKWAKQFSISDLVKRGILTKTNSFEGHVHQLLSFFGVGSKEAWENRYLKFTAAYRESSTFKSDTYSLITWLRIGEVKAQNMECKPYNETSFKSALAEIQKITSSDPEDFEPQMRQLCCESGVILTFVKEFPKTHLSGATFWLTKDKAVIIQSLRYKTDDHFWFTFFHEAGHILYGRKKLIIDEINYEHTDLEEKANLFASNTLIPKSAYNRFLQKFPKPGESQINQFAEQLNIAPGIVIGRLQHDHVIPFSWFHNMKRHFELLESNREL